MPARAGQVTRLKMRAAAAWVLLAAVLLPSARSSVVLQTGNYTFDSMADMPADFGPRISPDGVQGLLVVADPEDACTKLEVPVTDSKPWIALIVRSQRVHTNCTFDFKVRHAETAGASAAIVYDDVYESLIIMSKPQENPEPGIPAVFVSQKTGVMMKKLMSPGVTIARITPFTDELWMSMLMSACAGVLAVSVVVATFYFIRRHRMRHLPGRLGYSLMRGGDEGMTPAEMRALPVVIHEAPFGSKRTPSALDFPSGSPNSGGILAESESDSDGSPLGPHGGGTLKTCAICLEDYREGEKLRVLPCQHRFHMECIDQWLSSRKPLCPICKHDALMPLDPASPALGDEESGPILPNDRRPPTAFVLPGRRWRRWGWGRSPLMAALEDEETASLVHPPVAGITAGLASPGEPVDTSRPSSPFGHAGRLDNAGQSSPPCLLVPPEATNQADHEPLTRSTMSEAGSEGAPTQAGAVSGPTTITAEGSGTSTQAGEDKP
ncbi:hypothetical protein WJX72_002135 [[Myrmecia] bisecta]|uniref:RING-type E3 ubiquitin transferase n=1 Tax=[Myrmecia] bisecta TaxID=41462 RepID=A0AAW1PJB9_9CHLO